MKKTNFLEQLQDATKVVRNATEYIENAPLKEGQTLKLLKKGEDINDVPMVSRVDKYSDYSEFGVIAISKSNDKINIHLEGKGEVSDETKVFPIKELGSYYSLSEFDTCALADLISSKIK
jgi:hypothetical protein